VSAPLERLAVYVEPGTKRTFAGAIDWAGWSRSGKTEAEAVEALLAYADRYRAVLAASSVAGFPAATDGWAVDVVERVPGSSGTDFGVPSHPPSADGTTLEPAGAARLVAILEASWAAFDAAVEAARGHELRLGPRGGGRDLDKIVAHVREADASYLVSLGIRAPKVPDADDAVKEAAVRKRAGEVLAAIAAGEPLEDANRVSKPWTPRYYVRRAAWHALDHAWEVEDRRLD
jgi:hypothetical protein